MQPLYHPLDGQELLKWLLSRIKQELEGNYLFSPNQAYHNTFVADALAKSVTKDPTSASLDAQEKLTKKFKISQKKPILEPDRVRDEIGEPRYTTEKVGDILVDAKVKKDAK
jgi:aconitase A